jgi:RNA polymerase sigma-70 factor (ECF subfamily)
MDDEVDLALACSQGDAAALARFEASYLDTIPAALAHMQLSADMVDEVRQRVRHKLLVAEEGEPTKLEGYAGQGRLRGLIQIVAVRTAISMLRKTKREVGGVDLTAMPSPAGDPELRYLEKRYRGAFREAFEQAVRALTSRERNFLRLQVHAGLTVDQIGNMYGVHRATATRWLTKIRTQLLKDTRAHMGAALGASSEELDSVMNLIQSRLDVSVHRMLETVNEA